jgi:hypothetical protein
MLAGSALAEGLGRWIVASAAVVSEHLEGIRRVLRESIWAGARRYPIPLTPPRITALEARLGPLVDAPRNASDDERSAILDGPAALRRLLPGT